MLLRNYFRSSMAVCDFENLRYQVITMVNGSWSPDVYQKNYATGYRRVLFHDRFTHHLVVLIQFKFDTRLSLSGTDGISPS